MQKQLHPKNKHKNGYDFDFLSKKHPAIKPFLIEKFGKITVDFSNAKAVKEFNKALIFAYYGITNWSFSDKNLCPPIPGRVDYIHYLADLIGSKNSPIKNSKLHKEFPKSEIKILDIGTGASCIYPLLGVVEYNWNFVATDIELSSLDYAQNIINDNGLSNKITLRQQCKEEHILEKIIKKGECFTATMCNPPFYKSIEEAQGANRRKSKNLGNNAVRNFAGNNNELWYVGGEKAFLHTYLYESSKNKKVSKWFTSLVSKKENIESLRKSGEKLGVKKFQIIPMHQGNKITRIICWRF